MAPIQQPSRGAHGPGPAMVRVAPWLLAAVLGAAWWRSRAGRPERPAAPAKPDHPSPGEPADFDRAEPGRGRLATAPLYIPWTGWKDILWRTWREIGRDRVPLVTGGVTYYTLLAVFPALGAFVSIYGLVADVDAVRDQLEQLSQILPDPVVRLLGDQMMRLATERDTHLSAAAIVSVLLSIWSANVAMKNLFDGLNVAFEEVEQRNYFVRSALTYAFTFALLLFLTVVTGLLVAAPLVLNVLGLQADLLIAAHWLALFVVATVAFAVVYRYGPCRTRARWRWVRWGAVVAAFIWLAGSAGFSWYLNNVAQLQATYGSLGAVIGFMLWVWFSALVVLVGAELSAEIEHQTAIDSTVGPPKPLGHRGAIVADTVGRRFIGASQILGLLRRMLRRRWRGLRGRLNRPVRPRAPPGGRPGPRRSRSGRAQRPHHASPPQRRAGQPEAGDHQSPNAGLGRRAAGRAIAAHEVKTGIGAVGNEIPDLLAAHRQLADAAPGHRVAEVGGEIGEIHAKAASVR